MIATSSYKAVNNNFYKRVSISADRGADKKRSANYEGDYYQPLAPKKGFWRTWKDNIGKVPEMENNKYYIEHYFDEVLKNLDPNEIYYKLDNSILLCYESNMEFCHRHIVAAWLEDELKIKVPEIAYTEEHKTIELERPAYIKEMYEAEKRNLKSRIKRF